MALRQGSCNSSCPGRRRLRRHQARRFRLPPRFQIRSQGEADDDRIVAVVLKAIFGKTLLQIVRDAKRDIGVLDFSHAFSFYGQPYSYLFISASLLAFAVMAHRPGDVLEDISIPLRVMASLARALVHAVSRNMLQMLSPPIPLSSPPLLKPRALYY